MSVSVTKGQIYRKHGPFDWIKVTRVLIPGHPEYDGGLPGVSVVCSDSGGRGWQRRGWFVPAATDKDFIDRMYQHCRYLADEAAA